VRPDDKSLITNEHALLLVTMSTTISYMKDVSTLMHLSCGWDNRRVIYAWKNINIFKAAKIPQLANFTFNAVWGKDVPLHINFTPIKSTSSQIQEKLPF
jgi:hypothetical protein